MTKLNYLRFSFFITILFTITSCSNQEDYTTLEEVKIKADNYIEDILNVKINYCDSILHPLNKVKESTFTIFDNYSKICLLYDKDLFTNKDIKQLAFETVVPDDAKWAYFPLIGTMDYDSLIGGGLAYGFGKTEINPKFRNKVILYNLKYDYDRFGGSYKIVLWYPNPDNKELDIIAYLFFKDKKIKGMDEI